MAYQLKARETFSKGIKRIATEELDGALKGLQSGSDHSNVHDVRKRFKKLRAVLRLVRNDLGKKGYREANMLLRDAGRGLSGVRDAQVMVETLEALVKRFPDDTYQPAFEKAHKALLSRQHLTESHGEGPTERVAAKVGTLEESIAHWHISDRWNAVEPNLGRVYERGREAFKEVYRHPSDEGFHEWRKGVKDLWYHLRILNPLWPKLLKELAAQASTLADLLGNEHDLTVLSQTLATEPETFGGANKVELIQGLIETRREEIRAEARLLGRRLYADKPKRFTKRYEVYWHVWQDGKERRAMAKA